MIEIDKVSEGHQIPVICDKTKKNPEKLADITGINLEFNKRIGTILSVFSSGYEIDTDKFDMLKSQHNFILNYTIGTEFHHMHIK